MPLAQIGLVVHPMREISGALQDIQTWAATHDVTVVQLTAPGQKREVAIAGDASECDLIVAIGGDGTVLAAIRTGAAAGRPVMGVACGSLGALATVSIEDLTSALDRFRDGDWTAVTLPALSVSPTDGPARMAFNDLVVVRAAAGQVAVTVHVDGVLYGAYAGDGVIASTQLGSSAYGLAAGGPLLLAGSQAYVITPLAAHGGSLPPLILAAQSQVRIEVDPSHVGARTELDGQTADLGGLALELVLLADQATLVRFGDEEPYLTGLRRRRILIDSPRMYVREARMQTAGAPPTP